MDAADRAKMPLEAVCEEVPRALEHVDEWVDHMISQMPVLIQSKFKLEEIHEKETLPSYEYERRAQTSRSQRSQTSSRSHSKEVQEYTERHQPDYGALSGSQSPDFDLKEKRLLQEILNKVSDLRNQTVRATDQDRDSLTRL